MAMNEYGLLNPDDYNLTIVGLAASPTGAVATGILLFNAAATTTGNMAIADWCTTTNDTDAGSTFKITRPGLYMCVLGISMAAAGAAQPAISLDAPGQLLTQDAGVYRNPARVMAGAGVITTLADQTDVEHLPAVVPISQRLCASAGGIIRFHCTDGAGNAVAAASLNLDRVFARIQRIGDLRSLA